MEEIFTFWLIFIFLEIGILSIIMFYYLSKIILAINLLAIELKFRAEQQDEFNTAFRKKAGF